MRKYLKIEYGIIFVLIIIEITLINLLIATNDKYRYIYVPEKVVIEKEQKEIEIVNPERSKPVIEIPESTYFYDQKIFEITDDELSDVLKTVHGEAGTQDAIGKQLVLEVMCNRTLYSKRYGKNLYEVASKKNQFYAWKLRSQSIITEEIEDIYSKVKNEEIPLLACFALENVNPSEYVYFCTPKAYEETGYLYMKNIFKYGGHIFGTN